VQEPVRLKLKLQVIAPKLTAGSPSRTTHTIAQIQLMVHKDSYALKDYRRQSGTNKSHIKDGLLPCARPTMFNPTERLSAVIRTTTKTQRVQIPSRKSEMLRLVRDRSSEKFPHYTHLAYASTGSVSP
jgi:hypothetical protein